MRRHAPARRLAATLLALAALSQLAGCEWWLTFSSGGLTAVERLLMQGGYHIENGEIVPNDPGPEPDPGNNGPAGVTGGAPSGGHTGGGVTTTGGNTGGAPTAPTSPPPAGTSPAPPAPTIPASMTVAGRQWRVVEAQATLPAQPADADASAPAPVAPGDPGSATITLELLIENSGMVAAARLRIPESLWPRDESHHPLALAWRSPDAPEARLSKQPADAALNFLATTPPTLPLTWPKDREGIEIAGVRYDAVINGASLARTNASVLGAAALPITGVIDATAQRTGASGATKQMVRVRFAPEVIRSLAAAPAGH